MQKKDTGEMPTIPKPQIVYGELVYWITIASALIAIVGPALALIFPDNNVLPPIGSLSAIFSGTKSSDIWAGSNAGGFPGGHFYFKNLFTGDGFTQFGVALGCGVALPGLIGAAIAYGRSRAHWFTFLSLWVAFMIFFAAAGVINLH